MAKPAVLLNPRFLAALQHLSAEEIKRVERALRVLPDCFGQPHLHSWISVRRLRKNIFECRAGLKIRVLFRANAETLEVFFAGDHDEVARIIRHL